MVNLQMVIFACFLQARNFVGVEGTHDSGVSDGQKDEFAYISSHGYLCQPGEIDLETQTQEPAKSACRELIRLVGLKFTQLNRCDCLNGFESGIAETLNCYWAEADTWVYNDWQQCSSPSSSSNKFVYKTTSPIQIASEDGISVLPQSSASVEILLNMVFLGAIYCFTPKWWLIRERLLLVVIVAMVGITYYYIYLLNTQLRMNFWVKSLF